MAHLALRSDGGSAAADQEGLRQLPKEQFLMVGPKTHSAVELGFGAKSLTAHERLKEMPPNSMCRYTTRVGNADEVDAHTCHVVARPIVDGAPAIRSGWQAHLPRSPMTPHRPPLAVRTTLLVLALAGVAGLPVSAQSPGTTFGIGAGPISAYPDEFGGGGCDGRYAGFNVGVRRSLSSVVAIEGSLAWTGSLATSCALADDALSIPAPVDGATYTRTSLAPEIAGETFWATRVGAVVAPWSTGPVSPLVRVTGGRLWSKKLWTWTVGAGLRYGFGRQAVVLDLERWNLAYHLTRETWIYREAASDELQSRDVVQRRPHPWFVRLGWELTVGE